MGYADLTLWGFAVARKKKAQIKRYPLNMRTTKALRQKLERAATKSGRSLAQEVERRIERSLDFDHHLVIAKGDYWSPVLIAGDDIWIGLGDDPRDYPVPPDEPPHEENVVVLKVTPEDRKRLRNYFNGAPYPYDVSNEEIDAAGDAWIAMQRDIKRGK